MKTMKVKGFTLIELIVVMATFSIIMFGAMQLVNPVSKMMIQSETHETGNAAVSSISNYLEGQLSTAEYVSVIDSVLSHTDRDIMVYNFVNTYYGGVISNGGTATTTDKYGEGLIHVIQIDNTNDAKISSWLYKASFKPGATPIRQTAYDTEWAVNKAYYDEYDFEIKMGTFEDMVDFDASSPQHMSDFKAGDSSFTIKATIHKNKTDYSFLTTSNLSLVNIYNQGVVRGLYYVADEVPKLKADGTVELDPSGNTIYEPGLVDITSDDLRLRTKLDDAVNAVETGSGTGYTFVFSHGLEIDLS